MTFFLRKGYIIFLYIFLLTTTLTAQNNILSRISAADRSDGKGIVVRFHLSQEIDSFKVFQPNAELIQLTLYGNDIDTTGIDHPNFTRAYDEIAFYNLPFGLGVDIYVPEQKFFTADAYPDGNSNDLLIGLTDTSEQDLEQMTDGIDPVIWSKFHVSEESLLVGGRPSDSLMTFDNTYQQTKDKMKFDVIVIDPGHGGHDPGSIGYRGAKEKDIVLDIAKKLGGYIKEYLPEVQVVYTREKDRFIELEERGSIANRAEGDLFVSIHCNAHTSRQPTGTEIFFLGLERSQSALETMKRENSVIQLEKNPDQQELTQEDLLIYELANSGYIATSEEIAAMIDHQFEHRAQRNTRGVKQARLVVLYHASMPALLVETGFISNPGEQRYLSSDYGQSIIASAIFRAIRNYKQEYEKSLNFNTN